ncbi:HAD-superfamily subfamily IB hydrolase, TIGR01490 [Sphingomonas sp. OV641]|uniref:HAD family hydrolase n=1 Tax=Sphingomonas sp. OV641 TaxID=1881068 RepID=UPI0008BF9BA1|nr:HAD-IB family phosphatase [Sphingomonas sp. OV641]SEJ55924.1 HAD-superfamily subfamily IB hydrolase, TIGR01490 [Sphingomonas sp. OV641]
MENSPPVSLAIYDLDRTITSLPTWTPYLLFAARRLRPIRFALLPAVAVSAAARALGIIDRDRLKEAMHRFLLGPSLSPQQLEPVSQAFAEWIVRAHIRPGARTQMEADRREGRRIVIATAAHRFYADPIARLLGADDLVATEASRGMTGDIQPLLNGPNCYGDAKQAMIAAWFARSGMNRADTHIRFYSDHASDRPTFDWVDEAVAVNPHRKLRAMAAERGWRVVDWGGGSGGPRPD